MADKMLVSPVSAEDHERVRRAAERAGVPMAEYIRLSCGLTKGSKRQEKLAEILISTGGSLDALDSQLGLAPIHSSSLTPVEAIHDFKMRIDRIREVVKKGGMPSTSSQE